MWMYLLLLADILKSTKKSSEKLYFFWLCDRFYEKKSVLLGAYFKLLL